MTQPLQHFGFLLTLGAAVWLGRQTAPAPSGTPASVPPLPAGLDSGGACACQLRTVRHGTQEAVEALREHLDRNVPLRITWVPTAAVPDLRDATLREVDGGREVELRAIGARGRVVKGAERRSASLAEVLAEGGAVAAGWYAAQVSIPRRLPELTGLESMVPRLGPGEQDDLASLTGDPLPASPYLYYHGGVAGGGPALYLHYDATENLVQVLDGWKDFWLYDPFQAAAVLYGSNAEHGNASPVDVDSPYATWDFPLFRFAEPRRCRVSAGEWLYVPLYWWHRVRTGGGRAVSLTHFNRADREKKGFFEKTMCGYSLKPTAFECGKSRR